MVKQGEKVRVVSGTAVVVRGNEIDTDRIIPARYLKVVTFDGLGEFAFRDVRFAQDGSQLDHPFNRPEHQGARVLIVNKNFGCGSSREHAPQALLRWGIHAIVGESFAEIFAGNCNALGVPAVRVSEADVERLMSIVESDPSMTVDVDVDAREVRAGGLRVSASIADEIRESLVTGVWDSTAALLANRERIAETVSNLPYMSGFSA